jgi:hypothetical protein
MKNVFKSISVLMLLGALFVGCGSSNTSNGTTCSVNGINGTYQNNTCVASSAVSSQCTNPSYPYYVSTYGSYCCNTQSITSQYQISSSCTYSNTTYSNGSGYTNTGYTGNSNPCAQYGPMYQWTGQYCQYI